MNSQDFITAVRRYVMDAAIEDTISNLSKPPGRRPSLEAKERADWYNGLSAVEAGHVNRTVAISVHAAVFGLLAILDGVRTIDDGKGRFELAHVGDSRVVLNPQSTDLHDLLGRP